MHLGYRLSVLTALFFVALPGPLFADGFLMLSGDPDDIQCCVQDPGANQFVTVYVVAKYATGVTGFRFAAPVPSASGLVYVFDQSAFTLIGNSQVDVSVGLGGCQSGTFLAMQMQFLRPATDGPRAFYSVAPGEIYSDCGFADHPINTTGVMMNANGSCAVADKISPANGATDVPLTTSLSWSAGYSCVLADGGSVLYFGTTPDPPDVAYDVGSPYAVGPLKPGTTYYWNVLDPSSGPVWSFTTTTLAAAKSSTWGKVKALYR
jgi:hypothetical protein